MIDERALKAFPEELADLAGMTARGKRYTQLRTRAEVEGRSGAQKIGSSIAIHDSVKVSETIYFRIQEMHRNNSSRCHIERTARVSTEAVRNVVNWPSSARSSNLRKGI